MKALLNIVIVRVRTEFTRTQRAEGFFACLHVKRKMISERKEEVALDLAKNELLNCCGRRHKSGVLCACMFLTTQYVEKFST